MSNIYILRDIYILLNNVAITFLVFMLVSFTNPAMPLNSGIAASPINSYYCFSRSAMNSVTSRNYSPFSHSCLSRVTTRCKSDRIEKTTCQKTLARSDRSPGSPQPRQGNWHLFSVARTHSISKNINQMSGSNSVKCRLRNTYMAFNSHNYDFGLLFAFKMPRDLRNPHAEFRLIGMLNGILKR
jgi:hypothetical protein